MIRVGGGPDMGMAGEDIEYCGLVYPHGDEISKHMAQRLESEPFYQSDKLQQALAVTKNRRTAIDCGAWVGGWSREIAKHFERVLAIEANPDSARCVVKNVARMPNVAVLNAALGERSGQTWVGRDATGPNVASRVGDEGHGVGCFVQAARLDDVVEAMSDIAAVDYIKIHVNGMELKVLRGAAATIKRHRPVLTVVLKPALESYGDSVAAARTFLMSELGYKVAAGERPYEIWVPE